MEATPGADRPRRLADDRLPDPRRRALLLRHVLPARAPPRDAVVPAAAGVGRRRPGGAPRRGARGAASASSTRLAERRSCRAAAGSRPTTDAARRRRSARSPATYDGRAAASAARRSSRRRWCSSCCCATTRAPATRTRSGWSRRTCEAMARGGIYDQLGGGFARYSVDADWVVPHFEKMLYDNALLLRVYAHLWRATGSDARAPGRPGDRRLDAARAAHRRGRLRLRAGRRHRRRRGRDLRVDARPARRGARRGGRRVGRGPAVSVTPGRHLRARRSTLQLPCRPRADAARWSAARAPAARGPRPSGPSRRATTRSWPPGTGSPSPRSPRPARCSTGPTWSQAAVAAADLLPRVHLVDGRLRRVSRDGVAGRPAGVLEDYADVAEGLLALYAVTGEPAWLRASRAACSTSCSIASATAGAGSSTPPTTAPTRSWPPCAARRTPPTTPRRPGRRPRPARC